MEKIRFTAPTEAEILFDKELNNTDKLLFIVISTLSQNNKFCWATTKTLADIIDKTERYTQAALKRLKDKKYIYIQIIGGNKRIIKTYLNVCIDNKENIKNNNIKKRYKWKNH